MMNITNAGFFAFSRQINTKGYKEIVWEKGMSEEEKNEEVERWKKMRAKIV